MPGLLSPTPHVSSGDTSSLPQLALDEEELCFYQRATGIDDGAALASAVLGARREASEVDRSICDESDMKLVLARIPGYDKLLKIGRSRRNPIFLSISSRLGVDIRKAVIDGYPSESIIANDRDDVSWAIGERLFSQQTYGIPFLSGDLLDPYFLEAVWPFYTKPYAPPPALSTLKSLNPLHGQVSVVSICFVFDQLNASQQLQLARGIAGLLSAESGSMVIGVHGVQPQAGSGAGSHQSVPGEAFHHTPESWAELWDGQLFQKGTVKVEARFVEEATQGDGHVMAWTVVRL